MAEDYNSRKAVIVLGKTGAGKTRLSVLLEQRFGFHVIRTSEILEAYGRTETFFANRVRLCMRNGEIVTPHLVAELLLAEVRRVPQRSLLLDGAGRSFQEAERIVNLFSSNGWPLLVLYLDVSDNISEQRALRRGRRDDTPESIQRKALWFQEYVVPAIHFFKEKGLLVAVQSDHNGQERGEDQWESLEIVFQDACRHLRDRGFIS